MAELKLVIVYYRYVNYHEEALETTNEGTSVLVSIKAVRDLWDRNSKKMY